MIINFKGVPDPADYSVLPVGTYNCRVSNVEESATNNGDIMWNFTFEVVDGEHIGRRIFDRLVFSAKAMSRVKLICKRFGLNVDGEIDLVPSMFLDKYIRLDLEIEEYLDKERKTKQRNSVPFSGYHEPNGVESGPASSPSQPSQTVDDLPF